MSLDVYLTVDEPIAKTGPRSGIFVREGGETKEITREEWDALAPDVEPTVALEQSSETNEVYSRNITHNLGQMAVAAGVYKALWRPDENGIETAAQLIEPLTKGLAKLRANPSKFEKYNPANGWGNYDLLVDFVEDYLNACRRFPHAKVSVWR